MTKTTRIVTILFAFGCGVVCALLLTRFPPHSLTQSVPAKPSVKSSKMSNPGVYFEIPVTNIERATAFYNAVFGYEFAREEIHGNQMVNLPFSDGASGVTGALAKGEIYVPSIQGTLIYLHTEDADKTLKAAVANGGSVLFPRTAVGELGYSAEFKDSEGNRIGLFEKKK